MKTFMCYWGEGYTMSVELKDEEFFCGDNGYSPYEIAHIKTLDICDSYSLSGLSGVHIVTRVA